MTTENCSAKYLVRQKRWWGSLAAATLGVAAFLLSTFLFIAAPPPCAAEVSVGISVTIAPPPLPVYVQPPCPGPNYIWTPGYWAWDPEVGYYWVPGTWVPAPVAGWLWTPGYWAWDDVDGVYVWYDGYWGPVVGFYGGINYGYGYNGYGYYGGYWEHGTFYYNRSVNRVSTTIVNVYRRPVPRAATTRRVSFNGGRSGVHLRPAPAQREAVRHRASAPLPAQREHAVAARRDPALRAAVNQGRPAIAATPRPGAFRGPGVERATRAGGPYRAPASPGREGGGAPSRTPHQGTRERAMPPAGATTHPAGSAPREAPAERRVHPRSPTGGAGVPVERPAHRRQVEPRSEQPAQHTTPRAHPQAEPRSGQPAQRMTPRAQHPQAEEPPPMREMPRMEAPPEPQGEPRGQAAPSRHGGGEGRGEGRRER